MRRKWMLASLSGIRQDTRYAVRGLIRQPGFALVTIGILASVTGLNTSLFTFFNALTFHAPSGIGHPANVVSLYPAASANEPPVFALDEYEVLAERAESLKVAAVAPGPTVEIGDGGVLRTAQTLIVSGTFFDTLEVSIVRGRGLRSDDDRSSAPAAVAVLGASLWEARFGSDPAILGRSISLNGVPFTIVGIASREFVGLEPAVGGRPEVILTRASNGLLRGGGPSSNIGVARIVGRLRPGASRQQAAAEADILLAQFHARGGAGSRRVLVTGLAFLSQPGRGVIFVVLGMIEIALLLVWLLACANIGNLQLARAAARAKEIAIRLSGIPVAEIGVVTISSPDGPIDGIRRYGLVTQLTQSLRQLPIGDFGFTTLQPFTSAGSPTEMRLPDEQATQARRVLFAGVSPGYFRAMGIRLIAGRDVDASDAYRPVALINESMARRFWPHENALGKTFVIGRADFVEVIGIVGDLSSGLQPAGPVFFRPFNASTPSGMRSIARNGQAVEDGGGPMPFLIVRLGRSGAPDAIAAVVAQIDPRLRVKTTPLAQSLEEIRRGFRIGPLLAGALGVFALALATVGMFGVFAYAVKQRTHEIGLRMALGAQSGDVVRLVVGGHSRAVIVGLTVGLVGAIAASHAMRSFLYGVSPFDPLAYLGVAVLLACAGLAASYVPARRATSIDPIAALRCD